MTDWSLVGGDPAPGNPGALRSLAASESQLATLLKTLASDLGGLGHELGAYNWTGPAAHAVHGKLVATIPPLVGLESIYLDAAKALGTLATSLEQWQSQAAALVARYAAASDAQKRHASDASSADSRVRGLQANIAELQVEVHAASINPLENGTQEANLRSRLRQAESSLADARGAQSAAHSAADSARADMAQIQHSIDAIRDDHKRGATTATVAILNAVGLSAPSSNPLVNIVGSAMSDYKNFISSTGFQVFLQSCDTLSGEVSTLALLVAFIPVVGAPVAGAMQGTAKVLSVVSLAGHAARAANGDESWSTSAADLAWLVVPAGANRVAGAMSKDAKGFKDADTLSNAKRAIWYDDARHATGPVFHSHVHVVPKLSKVPPQVGRTYEVINTLIHGADDVHSGAEHVQTVRDVIDGKAFQPVQPSPVAP